MLSYCLSQSGLSSHLSLALMCLLGTHSALKVTSAALTSACFPWVSGRKGPIVFSARQLRDSTYLAIFSLVSLVTMRIILSKNAVKFFGMNRALQIHGIYSHITAKLDRFLSEPDQVWVKSKASYLLDGSPSPPFLPIMTSIHLPEGLGVIVACCLSPPSEWWLCHNCIFLFFFWLLYSSSKWKCDGVNMFWIFSPFTYHWNLYPTPHFGLISFHSCSY